MEFQKYQLSTIIRPHKMYFLSTWKDSSMPSNQRARHRPKLHSMPAGTLRPTSSKMSNAIYEMRNSNTKLLEIDKSIRHIQLNKESYNYIFYRGTLVYITFFNWLYNRIIYGKMESVVDIMIDAANKLDKERLEYFVSRDNYDDIKLYMDRETNFHANQWEYIRKLNGCYNSTANKIYAIANNMGVNRIDTGTVAFMVIASEARKFSNAYGSHDPNDKREGALESLITNTGFAVGAAVIKFLYYDAEARNKLNESILGKTKEIFQLRLDGMEICKENNLNVEKYKLLHFEFPPKTKSQP